MNMRTQIPIAIIAGVLFSVVGMEAAQAPEVEPPTAQVSAEAPSQNQLPELRPGPSIEKAFDDMYRLKFDDARKTLADYDRINSGDPLGAAAEAASFLFEEFQQKGVFSSAFFLDDKKLLGGVDGSVEQNRNQRFLNADARARRLANDRLHVNSRDAESLLALALADGMESDYDSLIEKKQIAALEMMKSADGEATRVLALDPSLQDAYVSLGVAGYVIGCLPSYKRAILWFGGIHGDRLRGIELMQNAASRGHYLQPFAKIMLALADEREHHYDLAEALLADLARQFPENPYFGQELAIAHRAASLH